MAETPTTQPEAAGGDEQTGSWRVFEWLRPSRRPRQPEASPRETLEELIEKREEAQIPISADEKALLGNILKLVGLSAADIMVPRADIVAVEINTLLPELLQLIRREAHSRFPVYRGTLDEVVGMVHIKDVLRFWGDEPRFKLADIVRKVLFAAPSMRVRDLLLEMRATRIHMALVVDEYGGIDGLVTIEDLVEEIVGDIEDEHDVAEGPRLVAQPDGSIVADARATIEEFEKKLGPILTAEEREGEFDTVGGMVVALAGRVPSRGEVIGHPAGVEFEVLDADPRRVKRLCIRRNRPQR